jgi:ABC-2 type transport system permease protein
MVLAFFLNFMIGYLMGLLAFWISKIESMQWLMFLGIRFLSGEHIPLEFFGQGFLFFSRFMPFYYIRYGVIQVYLGKFGIIGSLQFMFIQLVWIIILFYLIKIIWSVALKRYGAVG